MKNRTTNKRWKSIVGNAVFWTLIAGFLFYFTSVTFFPAQAMDLYGFSTYVVATDSMVPVINVNDYIVVKDVNPDDLVVGDIITFYSGRDVDNDGKDDIITHYLASITPYGVDDHEFKTHAIGKEDISDWDLWTLHDEDIIGKYAYTVPVLGFVVAFLQSPYGIAIVIINIVVIVAIYLLLDKGKKKEEAEKATPPTSTPPTEK